MLGLAHNSRRDVIAIGSLIMLTVFTLVVLKSVRAAGPQSVDVSTVALTGVSPTQAAEWAMAALRDPRVVAKLASDDFRIVEITDQGDGKSPPIVWIYNYTDDVPIAVFIARDSGTVLDAQVSQSMPNISNAERAEAAAIALNDPGVLAKTDEIPWRVANITGAVCPDGRRCLAVFLVPPDNDWDYLTVPIVDLGAKSVVTYAR